VPAITASSALASLRILDFSRVRAGPTCVKQFADFGADVIKIESPPGVDPNESMGGPRHGPDMQNLHRNKRSMTLNLKLGEARAVLERLVSTADVVVENYRPDESRTPATVRTPAPPPGTHTPEMLGRLGYPPAEIDALAQAGVIEAMK